MQLLVVFKTKTCKIPKELKLLEEEEEEEEVYTKKGKNDEKMQKIVIN
jgi:hypothetical protein